MPPLASGDIRDSTTVFAEERKMTVAVSIAQTGVEISTQKHRQNTQKKADVNYDEHCTVLVAIHRPLFCVLSLRVFVGFLQYGHARACEGALFASASQPSRDQASQSHSVRPMIHNSRR